MKPVKNLKEYINSNLLYRFYINDIVGGWRIKADNDGWVWVYSTNYAAPTCLRFHFDWRNEKAVLHIIPVGKGKQYKHEIVFDLLPDDFKTFDAFVSFVKTKIIDYKLQIVWGK